MLVCYASAEGEVREGYFTPFILTDVHSCLFMSTEV